MTTDATTPNIASGPKTLGKVRPHQTQNEALVFEKSSPGKRAYKLPPLDVPAVDFSSASWRSPSKDRTGAPRAERD